MRKFLGIVAFLLLGSLSLAQLGNRPVRDITAKPTGACNIEGECRLVNDGADIGEHYCCEGGLWTQVDVAAGTANLPWTDVTLSPYSAACDGSTDDSTALQSALTAATDNSILLFPDTGNCCKILTGLTLDGVDNVRLTGSGEICADGAITALTLDDSNKVKIDGLTIEHLDGDAGSIGLYVTSNWTANVRDLIVRGFETGIELDGTNASRNQHEIDLRHVEVECGTGTSDTRCNKSGSVGIKVESADNFIGDATYVRGYDIGIHHDGNETIYEQLHIYRWPSTSLQMDACIKVTSNGASISGLHTGDCYGDPAGTGGGVWVQAAEVTITESLFTWSGYCSTATTERCTADYDAACPGAETCCSTPSDTCEAAPSIYLDSSVVGAGTGLWGFMASGNHFDYSRHCANGGTCSSGVPGATVVKVDSVVDWEDNSRFNFIYGNSYSGLSAAERGDLIIRQPTAEQVVRFCAVGGTGEQNEDCELRFQRRGVTDAYLKWDETDDEFEINNQIRAYLGASGVADPANAEFLAEDDGDTYVGIKAPNANAAGVWFMHPALSNPNQVRSTTSNLAFWFDGVSEAVVNAAGVTVTDRLKADYVEIAEGATTTCISSDGSDRLYHDTDCDEVKDVGEEFIDQTGGGSPGGADTQVQYNNSGAFGGDAGFVYDAATDTGTIGKLVIGDGTAADRFLVFDDGTDRQIYWDDSEGRIRVDAPIRMESTFGVQGATPILNFFDTDLSTSIAAADMRVACSDVTASSEECEYLIYATGDGGVSRQVSQLGVDDSGVTYLRVYDQVVTTGISYGQISYTGSSTELDCGGTKCDFTNDLNVTKATSGTIYLRDSGGTSYACIIDTSVTSNFKCTTGSPP